MTTYIFLLIFIVVLCFFLVMLILSQNPKGGGLSGTFGGGGSQMFGVQRTNDFLDRATWVLAGSIAVLIILSAVIVPRNNVNLLPDSESSPQTEDTQAPSGQSPTQNNAPQPGEAAPIGE